MTRPNGSILLLALASALVGSADHARAQACGAPPLAIAGPDVEICAALVGSLDVPLSGVLSQPNVINGPILQYCWTTDVGTFAQSGTSTACLDRPAITLRVPARPGRQQAHVNLVITDFSGCVDDDQLVVLVETPPVIQRAEPSLPRACVGYPIELVAQAADTFSSQGLVTYDWDFNLERDSDLDGAPDNDVDASVVGVTGQVTVVTFVPVRPGISSARLVVRGEGSECEASTIVTFPRDQPPTVGIVSTQPANCPGSLSRFHAELSVGSAPGFLSWDFDVLEDANGDGDPANDDQARGENVDFVYFTGGPRTIRINAISPEECVGFKDVNIIVQPASIADFVTEGPGCGILAVTFRDVTGPAPPQLVTWTFGDGTGFETGPSRTHVYERPGTYVVSETVIDINGCTVSTTRLVEVGPSALTIESVSLLDGEPETGTTGNEDGFADPGERVRLVVTVRNAGSSTATGGQVQLAAIGDTLGVTVVNGLAVLPAIPAGASATTLSPHLEMTLSSGAPCGVSAPVRLTVSGFVDGSCRSVQEIGLRIGAPLVVPLGDELRVTQLPGHDSHPALAATEDLHGLVFESGAGADRGIRFERITSAGLPLPPSVRVDGGGAEPSLPRIAWDGQNRHFAVTWLSAVASERHVMFQLLDETGQPLAAAVPVDGFGSASSQDVAWTGVGWIVVFVDQATLGQRSAWARQLTPQGFVLGAPLPLDPAGSSHSQARVAAGGGTWAAALVRSGGGPEAVVDVRTAAGGASIATASLGSCANEPLAIASVGGTYLVALSTAGRVDVALVSTQGVLGRDVAGFGLMPALASGVDFAVLAWQDGQDVVARAISNNGLAAQEQSVVSLAQSAAGQVTLSTVGGIFLAAWSDTRPAHPDELEVYAQLLQASAGGGCAPGVIGDLAPAPDGNGVVDVGDVVLALRIAVGLEEATPEMIARGDVAPGIREGNVHSVIGDGVVDIGDVVILLQATVGQITLVP